MSKRVESLVNRIDVLEVENSKLRRRLAARNQAILERCHRRISCTNCIQLEARVVGLKLAKEELELQV